ncbi:MAG: LytTR family transcriptional regulator DNA-binding domain-containing protein [Xanthomonadales bacterium]|nr:LytTR family transcriptional regulator DNA-binding domain-containing protein [Xanthomonadales bacterium]
MESLRNYLDSTLPWVVGAPQYLRLFGTVFLLVSAGSALVHLVLPGSATALQVLSHGLSIGGAYTVVVALACAALYAVRRAFDRLLVWHVWLASLAAFLTGYFFLPLDNVVFWMTDNAASVHAEPISFLQLLPIWGLVTYFFVQPFLSESLRSELVKVRQLNALLEAGSPITDGAVEPIRFRSGKLDFVLEARCIRNVTVDDHYCYVHYRHGEEYKKRDLAMPLRDVLTLLPSSFAQVHRSHVVNLTHVQSIRRHQRNVRLVLGGGLEVPVSRHRLNDLLPLLRRQLRLG